MFLQVAHHNAETFLPEKAYGQTRRVGGQAQYIETGVWIEARAVPVDAVPIGQAVQGGQNIVFGIAVVEHTGKQTVLIGGFCALGPE